MLSPEVLNFKEPASTFHCDKIEKNNCLQKLTNFNFIHAVTVILPDTLNVPNSFGLELTNCDYYKIKSLNIGELVSQDFLHNFIYSGNLNLLSINTRIDCDDCVAITSSGKLILHLNKVTYQSLGIEGKLSHFHYNTKEKYIVTIDLKSETFKPGKNNYERIKSCLQKLKNFEIIISWEPPKKEICPSSVAKYFSNLGYLVELCKIKADSEIKYSIKVPVKDFDKYDEEDYLNFVEWLGMICTNCNLEDSSNYLSSYTTPEPYADLGQVKILKWKGFFNSELVADFLKELENYYGSPNFWKALYFQGFSDAPVVWGLNENHYFTNSDNGGVIILDKNNYYMCLQKCTSKRYK